MKVKVKVKMKVKVKVNQNMNFNLEFRTENVRDIILVQKRIQSNKLKVPK